MTHEPKKQTGLFEAVSKEVKKGLRNSISDTVSTGTKLLILGIIGLILAGVVGFSITRINVAGVELTGPGSTNANAANIPSSNSQQATTSVSCVRSESPQTVEASFDLSPGSAQFDTVFRSGHQIMLSEDRQWVYNGNNYSGYWEDEPETYIGGFAAGSWNIVHTFNNVGQGAFSVCIDSSGNVHGAVVDW